MVAKKRTTKPKPKRKKTTHSSQAAQWERARRRALAAARMGLPVPQPLREHMIHMLRNAGVNVHRILKDDVALINAYFDEGKANHLEGLTSHLAYERGAVPSRGSRMQNDPSRKKQCSIREWCIKPHGHAGKCLSLIAYNREQKAMERASDEAMKKVDASWERMRKEKKRSMNDPSRRRSSRDPETLRTIRRLEVELHETRSVKDIVHILEKLIALYSELGDARGVIRCKADLKRAEGMMARHEQRQRRRGHRAKLVRPRSRVRAKETVRVIVLSPGSRAKNDPDGKSARYEARRHPHGGWRIWDHRSKAFVGTLEFNEKGARAFARVRNELEELSKKHHPHTKRDPETTPSRWRAALRRAHSTVILARKHVRELKADLRTAIVNHPELALHLRRMIAEADRVAKTPEEKLAMQFVKRKAGV